MTTEMRVNLQAGTFRFACDHCAQEITFRLGVPETIVCACRQEGCFPDCPYEENHRKRRYVWDGSGWTMQTASMVPRNILDPDSWERVWR